MLPDVFVNFRLPSPPVKTPEVCKGQLHYTVSKKPFHEHFLFILLEKKCAYLTK